VLDLVEQALSTVTVSKSIKAETDTHFPLSLFDDDTYESRSLEAWFKLAREEILRPAPTLTRGSDTPFAILYGSVIDLNQPDRAKMCRNVHLLGFRAEDQKIMVHYAGCTKTAWAPRVQVYIWGEDPRRFAKRLAAAVQERYIFESVVRYHTVLRRTPTDGLPSLPPDALERLQRLCQGVVHIPPASVTSTAHKVTVDEAVLARHRSDGAEQYGAALGEVVFNDRMKIDMSLAVEQGL
ncbi:hypothetical protein KIPB_014049, partial [Kipferlia bialata]